MFFAPWCGHCKRLIPVWNQFAEINANSRLNIGIADCEHPDNNDLCTAFDISAYPKLVFLNDHKFYKYKGERTIEKFEQFVFQGEFEKAAE